MLDFFFSEDFSLEPFSGDFNSGENGGKSAILQIIKMLVRNISVMTTIGCTYFFSDP